MADNQYTFENKEFKDTYRHTTSHILAQAVKRLYPDVKLAIGPAIDDGFYYDFDSDKPITPEMLEALEAEMKKICKEKLPLERFELPREEAIKLILDYWGEDVARGIHRIKANYTIEEIKERDNA